MSRPRAGCGSVASAIVADSATTDQTRYRNAFPGSWRGTADKRSPSPTRRLRYSAFEAIPAKSDKLGVGHGQYPFEFQKLLLFCIFEAGRCCYRRGSDNVGVMLTAFAIGQAIFSLTDTQFAINITCTFVAMISAVLVALVFNAMERDKPDLRTGRSATARNRSQGEAAARGGRRVTRRITLNAVAVAKISPFATRETSVT